jgi:hypothetical protein
MPPDVRTRSALPSSFETNSGLRPNHHWAKPKIQMVNCRKAKGLPHIDATAADFLDRAVARKT